MYTAPKRYKPPAGYVIVASGPNKEWAEAKAAARRKAGKRSAKVVRHLTASLAGRGYADFIVIERKG